MRGAFRAVAGYYSPKASGAAPGRDRKPARCRRRARSDPAATERLVLVLLVTVLYRMGRALDRAIHFLIW